MSVYGIGKINNSELCLLGNCYLKPHTHTQKTLNAHKKSVTLFNTNTLMAIFFLLAFKIQTAAIEKSHDKKK